jgi:hypothetical protein
LLESARNGGQNGGMRWHCALLLAALAFSGDGCAGGTTASHHPFTPVSSGSPNQGAPTKTPTLIVTPASEHRGKIILVNASARYVVLNCPFGYIPALDRTLNVYRSGLKVAEIKITGPQRDTSTVGDIITGECQVGDEAREN